MQDIGKRRVLRLRFVGYPQQLEFLNARERTIVFQAGAGAGKTKTGMFWSLMQALTQPGSRGMIVSSSHPQMEQSIVPHLMEMGQVTKLNRRWRWNANLNKIRFPNGSLIFLRSADRPESLLGADLAWGWGDEVALWKQNSWRYFYGRIRQSGYRNQIAVTMTPKGRNWAYKALGKPSATRRIIHATSADNVYLPDTYVEAMTDEYGEGTLFYRQEVGGEYVAYEGLIYDVFDEEDHVEPIPDVSFKEVIAGVDWGWGNPYVILVIGITRTDHMWVLHETYERKWDLDRCADEAAILAKRYGITTFYADPSEPANIQSFRSRGLDCVGALNDVVPGIACVNGQFANGMLHFGRGVAPNTVEELGNYAWKKVAGEVKEDDPVKVADHAMDALRYAVYNYRHRPESFIQVL